MTRFAFSISTRQKQKAHEETGCQDAGTLPIIGLPALLKLADWISQKRHEATHGGATCVPAGSDQIPPVQGQPNAESSANSPLGGTAGPGTPTNPADTPSGHR